MRHHFLLPLFIFLVACGSGKSDDQTTVEEIEAIEFYGNTQGTTYAIIINDPVDIERDEIEELLANFDLALSAYIPNSILTRLNEAEAGELEYQDKFGYFNDCYLLSQDVYQLTNGAFDPTVYPLVDGWGFMNDVENVPDSSTVDSLRALTGFSNGYHFNFLFEANENDTFPASKIIKNTPGAKLDFNAIAQGLAVDMVGELIEKKGGKNYFVEIGGEIRVKGKNGSGDLWRIGIDKPIEGSDAENRELQEIIQLDNKSVATSGSYRKFYEKNGVKFSHTLDPRTGYPVKHSLLSATVVAESCALADAMATALMVMGPDKGKQFLKSNPDLDIEAYLIYQNKKDRLEVFYTKGFRHLITE